jgi:hypothetical protein
MTTITENNRERNQRKEILSKEINRKPEQKEIKRSKKIKKNKKTP